jgi:DNA-binding transcriptional ArsR family regulator
VQARSGSACGKSGWVCSIVQEIWLDMEGYATKFDHTGNMEAVSMDEKHAVAALGALAQETRLALFRLLVTCGPEGMAAGMISERLGVPPSSLSFHLQQLVHAGLITQRRLSRQLLYSADYGTMNELMAYLTENCCGRGAVCPPVCNPADAFAKGESDEAPARARRR